MALTRLKGSQILDNTITIADLAVTDGTVGQGLLTDGAGGLSFGNVATSVDIPNPTLFAGGTHSSQSSYTLAHDPGSANGIQVYVDDVLQRPATNYGVIGTTLTFTATPADTADIYIIYEGFYLGIGTVADASITSAKFANNSITVDKLAIANFATPETFTGVTNQTSFVLAMNPGSAYAIFVYLNTVFQRPGPDYTLTTISGVTSLIFTTAPAAGDEIYVRYGMQAMPSGISSVGDGTLTIAKFAPSTFLVDSFIVTASAGQQDFTLTRNPGSVYAMFVVVEGIIQKPLTHYTISGTTLSFASVLPVDSEVEVHLNGFPSPLNAPADATVGRTTLLTTNSSASGLVLKVSSNNTDLEWGTIVSLPTQTGQSGKYLTTDGTDASWSTVVPSQTSNAGKYLTTNGSVISWATVDALPAQTSHSGKFLTTDGSAASWADVPAVTVSDTPPGSPAHSDLWWDSVLGKLKIYYNDGTSSQWVDAHQIGSIDPTMGGDLTGATSNAQIVANAVGATEIATNAVGITELNVTDGTVGQALTTDGSGTLGFADAGASVTISDTAPGSASAGDLWWKSDTGRLKVYYDDGSGAQWVDASPTPGGGSSDPAVGGDLTGTASNAQIAANAVGTAEIADNIELAGTSHVKIPAGTTAQRPGSPAVGNVRVNTTIGQLEHYYDSNWIGFAGSTPIISNITPTLSIAAGTNITVTGINFQAGTTVKLIGTDNTQYNAQSVTFINSTEIQFTTPELPVTKEPYDVKVILPSLAFVISTDILDAGGIPTWTTAAGLLGDIADHVTGTHFTLAATDPDSQAVTFAETTSVLTIAGLTLNSDGTITGDPTNQTIGNPTTYNFDATATDSTGVNVSSTRSFSITVNTQEFASSTGGTETTITDGGINYKVHTFLSTGTFNPGTGGTLDKLLVVAGGGGGSGDLAGGGGAGGYRDISNFAVAASTPINVTVGPGGPKGEGNDNASCLGTKGGNSTFSTISATGGGEGGREADGTGRPGGSGAGGAAGAAGAGNQGGYTPVEGNDGGAGQSNKGGGGGGSDTVGQAHQGSAGGAGGAGTQNNIDGNNYYWAGGGGASNYGTGSGQAGAGGIGGGGGGQSNEGGAAGSPGGGGVGGGTAINSGGDGSANSSGGFYAGAGGTNSGGGGGGAAEGPGGGGDGGSGIVILRYVWYG